MTRWWGTGRAGMHEVFSFCIVPHMVSQNTKTPTDPPKAAAKVDFTSLAETPPRFAAHSFLASWYHHFALFFWEMRPSVFSLSFVLYTTTAFAARFPIKKISKHHLQTRSSVSAFSPHVLASSSNPSPDNSDLRCVSSFVCITSPRSEFSSSTINDMIYVTNVRSESLLNPFVYPRSRLP